MTTDTKIRRPRRRAGVCLHIASLPGAYGIGEIGAAARSFVDRLCRMNLAVWQFLPIGPTGFGNSPYQPLSTFAGNEMLIDIEDLIALDLLTETEAAALTKLPESCIDYGALIPVKTQLLNTAASRFAASVREELSEAFDVFVAEHDKKWLHDYALFRVLKARHNERPWFEWHPNYARREESALADVQRSAGEEINTIKIIQFLFFRQWSRFKSYANDKGIELFGDMPIYIALDSADAWANREILCVDADGRPDSVAGVPPDYFSEDGQLWGNPLYDWKQHDANGYRWWIERLRASSALVDLVRIDHFRGFESYWSVPAGATTARVGQWETGPGDALFDAVRAQLGSLPIVAEDLGLITPEVEALRVRQRLPGMRVLQFDVTDPEFSLDQVGADRVCYTGTHDNDTTAGWFFGGTNDERTEDEIRNTQEAALRITGGTAATIHTDLIKAAFSTRAELAIAPMQDYLGLGTDTRLNTPGTSQGNWRWRVSEEQFESGFCARISALVNSTGRGNLDG